MTADRLCSEPNCGTAITRQSKTGRCRPCAIRRMHADPEYQRARREGLATYYDQPGVRAVKTADRVCSEPNCAAVITRQSKTGRCRPCAIKRMHADPEYQRKRRAGLATYYDQPGVRARHGDRLRQGRANPTSAEKERRSEHGRWLYANHASRPEVIARAQSREARRRAIAGYIETRMGWCPPHLREAYHDLLRCKRVPAAEARRMIEAEIPGTVEHARLEIANRHLAQALRRDRDRAEAY